MIQEALTEEDLNTIWSATASDIQTKFEIYKTLSGAAATYHVSSNDLKHFLITKMAEINPADFGEKELELVLTIGRVVTASSEYAKLASELFWKIIMQEQGYKSVLIEKSLDKFNELLRSTEKSLVIERGELCVKYLKEGKASLQCMKILQHVIEITPETTLTQGVTKSSFCEKIIEEGTVSSILEDLANYLKYFRSLFLSGQVPKGADIDTVVVPETTFSHRQHIFLRVTFLAQLFDCAKQDFKI